MKRYWASAALAAFIAITIGTYYVQASFHHLPQFRLKMIEGDSAEANRITLMANYSTETYRGEPLRISAEGSRYDSERSLWERVNEDPHDFGWPAVRQLVREHPNFMRGNPYSGNYYQDDEWLVRAKFQEEYVRASATLASGFQLAVLDKKSNRSRSFTLPFAEKLPLNTILIVDVQRAGSILKLAVLKYAAGSERKDPPPPPEFHVYDVDVSAEKVVGDHVIEYTPLITTGPDFRLFGIQPADPTQPGRYLALSASIGNGSISPEIAVYDYLTGNINLLTLPGGNRAPSKDALWDQQGDRLLFLQKHDSELVLTSYRLADRLPDREIRWTGQDLPLESIHQMVFGSNRLYILFKNSQTKSVAALDTTDGGIVYRGEVKAEAQDQQTIGKLEVYSMQAAE